ncbi:hypothetical protein COU57_03935 [Candidatus Pacearchaeota archaeon CG10_big_fil_rev_8_21_14_0_10_32_14]|nr:MAG: hypothetical protein COU57_03935 [Candidatus Pacearchaeota archaeon CG10_big_fil_rev_8_21_14_0_10_32_14]
MISEENSTFNENSLAKASKEELIDQILKEEEIFFPIEIFSSDLSPLEAITLYLREKKNFRINKIAEALNKNSAAISLAYKNSKKKNVKFTFKETQFEIPLSLYSDGKNVNARLSISEITTLYMRERGMNLTKIANLMDKNVKTVWTFSRRGMNKLKTKRRSPYFLRASPLRKKLERKSKDKLLKKLEEVKSKKVPLSIFAKKLSPLEALSKYLLERENKSITEISKFLGKNKSSISIAYKNSKSKKLYVSESSFDIPILFFSNNSYLSLSEAVTKYLVDDGVSFSEIAGLLNVDNRTAWTFYHRVKLKMESYNEK